MIASRIDIKNLNSYDECADAIESIESDHNNVIGEMAAWISGHQTFLKKGAENKIAAIEKRIENKFSEDED